MHLIKPGPRTHLALHDVVLLLEILPVARVLPPNDVLALHLGRHAPCYVRFVFGLGCVLMWWRVTVRDPRYRQPHPPLCTERRRTFRVPHGHVVELADAALVAKLVGPVPLVAREAEVRQRLQQPEHGRFRWVGLGVWWEGDVSAPYIKLRDPSTPADEDDALRSNQQAPDAPAAPVNGATPAGATAAAASLGSEAAAAAVVASQSKGVQTVRV